MIISSKSTSTSDYFAGLSKRLAVIGAMTILTVDQLKVAGRFETRDTSESGCSIHVCLMQLLLFRLLLLLLLQFLFSSFLFLFFLHHRPPFLPVLCFTLHHDRVVFYARFVLVAVIVDGRASGMEDVYCKICFLYHLVK